MQKVGRNDPCPCGSGKKFKKCCEFKMIGKKFLAQKIEDTDLVSSAEVKLTSFFHSHIPVIPEEPLNKKINVSLEVPEEKKEQTQEKNDIILE